MRAACLRPCGWPSNLLRATQENESVKDMGTLTETSSRERLADTLNHKQPDRIPIDFGGTAVTGVHASCVAELRNYYGLEKRPVRIHEPFQMLALLDDDLLD